MIQLQFMYKSLQYHSAFTNKYTGFIKHLLSNHIHYHYLKRHYTQPKASHRFGMH